MTRRKQHQHAYLASMRRMMAGMLVLIAALRANGQEWRPGNSIELIRRAAAHRAARDADTLLASWQAEAHGFLRYASVLDHGDGPVERVVKQDELRIEVYGVAPNQSKQVIRAWRDTSYLPNRIVYHRDHLGIVANDFGPTIRLGQGEEVRDVPHPLSDNGISRYVFAVGDTVILSSPVGRTRVVAVHVRPVDADSAGTVGTLYLDIDRAALVTFRFTFTPVSYRDPTVEEITVTLENSLQERTRWLPWRQSIMIRRGDRILDLPQRNVIRADWVIDNYELGVKHPPDRFGGPFLVGPTAPMRNGAWDAPMASLDSLPATTRDVEEIEREATRLLGGRILDGLPRLRLLGAGISDFVHVNRAQGVAPAVGLRVGIGSSVIARARIGIGLSDHRVVGSAALEKNVGRLTLFGYGKRLVQDIGDAPVISGLANSIGTLISGDDFGDYMLMRSAGFGVRSEVHGTLVSAEIGFEAATPVATAFTPLSGTVRSNPDLGRSGEDWVTRVTMSRRDAHGDGWTASWTEMHQIWSRGYLSADGRIPLSSTELRLSARMGATFGNPPAYRAFALGGRGTLLGVPFRAIGGRRMALAEIAWAIPVALPTPRFPYSRLVRLPSTIAPYLAAGVAGGDMPILPWRGNGRIEPVAGVRLDLWGPLVRLDAGISLRTGQVGLAFDIHPDWWSLM